VRKFLSCFFATLFLFAQFSVGSSTAAAGWIKLTVEEMHEELDITLDLLRDQHPNFGHHTSKKEVEQSFADAKKAIVRPLNLLAYYRILFPLVSQIGEFHTYLEGNDDLRPQHN